MEKKFLQLIKTTAAVVTLTCLCLNTIARGDQQPSDNPIQSANDWDYFWCYVECIDDGNSGYECEQQCADEG